MLKNKDAFTMAETLITISLIGVLAALLIPAMRQFTPDRNKTLFKKAANTAERIVYEIYNDDEIYPRTGRDGVTQYDGFDNTERVVFMGNDYGHDTDAAKQKSKFCNIFVRKLSTKSDAVINCTDSGSSPGGTPSVTTIDGIAWYLPIDNFSGNTYKRITVDVNGTSKGPNCYVGSPSCNDPDIFYINVNKFGNVDFYTTLNPAERVILQQIDLFKH